MAGAPIKLGLKYGYIETDFHQDENFEKLRISSGPKSTTFYILLRNYIFAKRGYYFQYTDEGIENFLAWSKHTPWFNKQGFAEFVSAAVRYDIFDREIFERFSVLTSHGIQHTWMFATNGRRMVRYIIVDYWLFTVNHVDDKELLLEKIMQNKQKMTLYINKEDIDYVDNLIAERATYSEEELSGENMDETKLQHNRSTDSKISYEQFLQQKRYEGQSFMSIVRRCSVKYCDASDNEIWKMFAIFCNRQINLKANPDNENKLLGHFLNWLEKAKLLTSKTRTNEKNRPSTNAGREVGEVSSPTENGSRYGKSDPI